MRLDELVEADHADEEGDALLRGGFDDVDVTADPEPLSLGCFPAGTLSGAPKVRAMEIIEELEGTRRGPYGGAVGYFSFDGSMDTCITIRTLEVEGDRVAIQGGRDLALQAVRNGWAALAVEQAVLADEAGGGPAGLPVAPDDRPVPDLVERFLQTVAYVRVVRIP